MVLDKGNWRVARRYSLERFRPLLLLAQMILFVIGAAFWVMARHQIDAFNAATFGSFAVQFPAEMWAGAMMVGAAFAYVGLIRPIRRKLVAVGASVHVLHFTALSYSTTFTGGEHVIGLYASFFFSPLHLWMIVEANRNAA